MIYYKHLINTAVSVPPTLLVMVTQMVSAHCSLDARPNFIIRTGGGREAYIVETFMHRGLVYICLKDVAR